MSDVEVTPQYIVTNYHYHILLASISQNARIFEPHRNRQCRWNRNIITQVILRGHQHYIVLYNYIAFIN
jgi:hypothetical protein